MADASFDADVAVARGVYAQLGPWIDRYRGGIPPGFIAAAIAHESGGNFNAPGDASLGEIGYLQVASYVPALFGYPAEARMDPESNIAIGVLEYELEAAYWKRDVPAVALGTADSWKLARLAFAVGRAGSRALAAAALQAFGDLQGGNVYGTIKAWTTATGGIQLGSQSAQKVASRVADIDRQWAIGEEVAYGWSGPPTLIPDPPAGPYTIPADAAPYFVEPISGTILLIGGLSILAYLLYKRRM